MAGLKTSNVVWTTPVSLGATCYVVASDAKAEIKAWAEIAQTGGHPVWVCDGTADNVEIQAAIDALTAARTWKETVKCIGTFTLAAVVVLASYAILDLTDARLVNNSQNTASPYSWLDINGKSYIEIRGGIFSGNAASGDLADRADGYAVRIHGTSAEIDIINPLILYPRQNGIEAGESGTVVTNLRIHHPTIYGYRAAGINVGKVQGGIVKDFFIKAAYGVLVEHGPASNIEIGPGTYEHDDTPTTGSGYGFNVVANQGSISNIKFKGLTAKQSGYLTALYIYAESTYNVSDIKVDGATFVMGMGSNYGIAVIGGAGASGTINGLYFSQVYVTNSPAASGFSLDGTNIPISNIHFTDCKSYLNYQQGFEIVTVTGPVWFLGCEAIDNNVQVLAGNSGFYLSALTLGYVIGCRGIDTRTPKLQSYGLRTFAGDVIYAYQNDFNANLTAGVLNGGGILIARSNIGYVTENSGTATVLNTTTSIVVNHGLATTPTRVIISLTNNPTNDPQVYWVSTLTATQFTINTKVDPGATGAIFDWRAQVGEG